MFWEMKTPLVLHRPQMELLAKFRNCARKEDISRDIWDQVVREDAQKLVLKFKGENLITEASLEQKISYSCKVSDLKTFLKNKHQKVTMNKPELVALAATYSADKFIKDIEKQTVYALTEIGEQKVNSYLEFKRNEREEAENKVMNFLKMKEFRFAVVAMAEYEAKQVFPRGMGINWTRYNPDGDVAGLEVIFSDPPKLLKDLPADIRYMFQLAGAMEYLWGVNDGSKWLPPDLKTNLPFSNKVASRMVSFKGTSGRSIRQYESNSDVVWGVQILSVNDDLSCDECKQIAGKEYKLGTQPSLPNENCTCEMGCRCCYSPIVVDKEHKCS